MKNSDKKKKSGQGRGGSFAATAVFFLIGAISGRIIFDFLEANAGMSGGRMLAWFLVLIGVMYAGLVSQIAVHEAGHLLFGLLTGYSFCSYRLFSLMWMKERGHIVFRRFSIAGTGGQCLMSPPDPDERGRVPFVLYNLGGVIVNLVSAFLFLVPAILLPDRSFFAVLFRMLTVIALGFALVNGFPLRIGAVDNDGVNTRAMLREPAAVEIFWQMMKINELSARGERLRDMPAAWFGETDEALCHNSIGVSREVFRLNRLLDEGRYAEMAAEADAFLRRDSALNGIYRNLLICDLATCLLLTGRREEAAGWLTPETERFMKTMRRNPSVLRCGIAAALLRDGDEQAAAKLREQFEAVALTHPYPAEIEAEREILAAVAKASGGSRGAE